MSRTFRNADDPAFVTLLSAGLGNGFKLDLCVYHQQISSVDLKTARALRDALTEALAAAVEPSSPMRVCNRCFNAAKHRSIVHHFDKPGPCSICGEYVPRFCSIAAEMVKL